MTTETIDKPTGIIKVDKGKLQIQLYVGILILPLAFFIPMAAYSGDGEHRFRFYREHLNSTHWVHDIFNLSVHDGQF
jgi:hypothetical protein